MLLNRLQQLSGDYSFFLFGARGVGKSTLIEERFNLKQNLYINLLIPEVEDKFARNPSELAALVESMPAKMRYVILDEVQKVPKLLDVVHSLIENKKSTKIFIMTGSSARKLKARGVNLLAGRAFVFHLFPFSYLELDQTFNLHRAISYGLLPRVQSFKTNEQRQQYLQAYTLTYLKEEIWAEQLIKNLDPFRKFLEVAAQCSGKIINYSNIARDVGVDDKTVKNYFTILEDTLLGNLLEPYHHSFRKRLKLSPKFYFFDTGVVRALARMLSLDPLKGTSYYGELFEQFIVVECLKLADYYKSEYKFSYLMTASGSEIDLVVERPGQQILFIEIKSSSMVAEDNLTALERLAHDFGECEAVCFSQDEQRKKLGNITVYPWREGIRKFFT